MIVCDLDLTNFAMQDEVRDIMRATEGMDAEAIRPRILALEGRFDTIFERWWSGVCQQLRDVCTRTPGIVPEGIDPLQLATAAFTVCQSSRLPDPNGPCYTTFPSVTAHRCVARDLSGPGHEYERSLRDRSFLFTIRAAYCVSCDYLRVVRVTRGMRRVVQLFGLDPDTAIAAQMDAVDARLIVQHEGSDAYGKPLVRCMTWRHEVSSVDCTLWVFHGAERAAISR